MSGPASLPPGGALRRLAVPLAFAAAALALVGLLGWALDLRPLVTFGLVGAVALVYCSNALVRGITEHRQAEAAVGASEARFRALAQQSPGGIYEVSIEGMVTSANDRFAEMTGITESDLGSVRYLDVVHPDDRGQMSKLWAASVESGEPFEMEHRLVTPGGEVTWVSCRATTVYDDAGEPTGYFGAALDITSRRLLEADLRVHEQVTAHMAEGVVLVRHSDDKIVFANRRFSDIFGYELGELDGRNVNEINAPGTTDPVEVTTEIQSAVAEYGFWTGNIQNLKKDGTVFWTHATVSVFEHPEHGLVSVSVQEDITDRRRYEQQLQHMADHDPLTGLLNRRSFERELQRHVAEIERYGAHGAAIVLDLDNFKYYNDTLGHHVGDELIVRMSRVLEDRLRETDVLARLGGDEFAVILPKEDVDGARRVAEALLDCVRAEGRKQDAGRGKAITASIGIAMFDDEERLTGQDVLVNADLAMYDAKEAGRDRVCVYSSDGHTVSRMKGRIKWVDQIRKALDEQGFTLLAQPISDLRGQASDRYELLLRMKGDGGELIPPGAFLYIAERLGWVNEIDRWVSHQAIEILAEERDRGRDINLEVNLSGLSMGDDELLAQVEHDLHATGVDPSCLTFEITETAAVANISKARAFAEQLSELGCKFALDDFGAGFGSFYYLKHLPFDFLKIDGEFVKGCTSSETDRLLIEAVVSIARGMGKRTIAEFVGDEETVRTLRRLGVDFGQGYHLGRPAPLQELLGAEATRQ